MNELEFEQKYKEYSQMIKNIAYTYLNSSSESDDVLQEVFIKYLTNYEYLNNHGYEKYWIIRVTINICKDYLKNKRHQLLEFNEAYHIVEDYQDKDYKLYNSILLLKEKYKSVIILYYYEEMQISEISKTLKISQSAVKMRLKRAKELLRKKEVRYD